MSAHERARQRRAEREARNDLPTRRQANVQEQMIRSNREKKEKALDLQKQNQESLSRSLAMAHKSKAVGAETMTKLDTQGEQLRHIEKDVDEVDETLGRTNALLGSIKSWGVMMKNSLFGRPKSKSVPSDPVPDTHHTKNNNPHRPGATRPTPSASSGIGRDRREERKNRTAAPDTQQKQQSLGRYDDEDLERNRQVEDQQLDDLYNVLTDLKEQAKDMNYSLDEQNETLDRIDEKVDKTNAEMERQNRVIRKLLN